MTAQLSDGIRFNGYTYHLVGGQGGPLATPHFFGMESEMLSTACYHGYHALYELVDGTLVLREFTLRETHGRFALIDGIAPVVFNGQGNYRGLHLLIPYTGTLRLGFGSIRDVDSVRSRVISYQQVLDVVLENGAVRTTRDRSAEVAEKRRRYLADPFATNQTPGDDLN